MAADSESMKLALEAEKDFGVMLNEAIDKMRNPDRTIPIVKMVGIQTVLLFSAGYMEGMVHYNQQLITGHDGPRLPLEEVCGAYGAGFDKALEEILEHGDEIEAMMKFRLAALKTKVL